MLYDDRPIDPKDSDQEDKLNRQPFVDDIFELIDQYTRNDEQRDIHEGLVVGLEGSWDSGKTSVLNFLEKKFQDDENG